MEPPRLPPPKPDARLPVVLHNPYQASAVVTPDIARQQGKGRSLPSVKTGGGSTSAAGRGNAGGAGGESRWEAAGEGLADDGLRQMPPRIAVQDVYPPELSR